MRIRDTYIPIIYKGPSSTKAPSNVWYPSLLTRLVSISPIEIDFTVRSFLLCARFAGHFFKRMSPLRNTLIHNEIEKEREGESSIINNNNPVSISLFRFFVSFHDRYLFDIFFKFNLIVFSYTERERKSSSRWRRNDSFILHLQFCRDIDF